MKLTVTADQMDADATLLDQALKLVAAAVPPRKNAAGAVEYVLPDSDTERMSITQLKALDAAGVVIDKAVLYVEMSQVDYETQAVPATFPHATKMVDDVETSRTWKEYAPFVQSGETAGTVIVRAVHVPEGSTSGAGLSAAELKIWVAHFSTTLFDQRAAMAKVAATYPDWAAGTAYAVDELVSWKGILYKTLQGHTSQVGWEPDVAASLFAVNAPAELVLDWVQPAGSHDAYQIGDKVLFNGVVYESLINANVWSPVAHAAGWKAL